MLRNILMKLLYADNNNLRKFISARVVRTKTKTLAPGVFVFLFFTHTHTHTYGSLFMTSGDITLTCIHFLKTYSNHNRYQFNT